MRGQGLHVNLDDRIAAIENSRTEKARVSFFVVAPFCSCPASLVSRKFLLSAPGVQSVFFLLRSVGRRDLSAGPEQKNFLLLWPRAGAQRGFSFPCLSPRPEQKKKHPGWWFFFCSGPVPAPNGASPSLAFRRGRSKKKTPWVVFFFFCSGPVPAPNGASPSPAFRRGRSKKKHPGWCFFFAAAPRGRSLTHCGPGWRCLPLAGVVFFFCCGPARTGVVFFFAVAPPGRSLTHGGLGRFRQGPGGVFFFCCGPAGSF